MAAGLKGAPRDRGLGPVAVRRWGWRGPAALALVIALAAFVVPVQSTPALRRATFLATGILLLVVVLRTAMRAHREAPRFQAGWWTTAVAMTLLLAEDAGPAGSRIPIESLSLGLVLELTALSLIGVAGLLWQSGASTAWLPALDAGIIATTFSSATWIAVVIVDGRAWVLGRLTVRDLWVLAGFLLIASFPLVTLGRSVIFVGAQRRKLVLLLMGTGILVAADAFGLVASLAHDYWFGALYVRGMIVGYGAIAIGALIAPRRWHDPTAPNSLISQANGERRLEFALIMIALATSPLVTFALDFLTASEMPTRVHEAMHYIQAITGLILFTLVALRMLLVRGTLQETARNLRAASTALDESEDAVVTLDADMRITSVTPAFVELYGWRLVDIIGSDLTFLDGGDQDAEFWVDMESEIATSGEWSGTVRNRTRTGDLRTVHLAARAIRDDDHRTIAYVQVHHDLHDAELVTAFRQRDEGAALGRALARTATDNAAKAPNIADGLCAALATLPGAVWSLVAGFDADAVMVLAAGGSTQAHASSGGPFPAAFLDILARQARDGGGWLPADAVSGISLPPPWERLLQSSTDVQHEIVTTPLGRSGAPLGFATIAMNKVESQSGASSLALLEAFADAVSASLGVRLQAELHQMKRRSALQAVIAQGDFTIVFQPICDLASGEPRGFEALTRFPTRRPDEVFDEAATLGVGTDLELATIAAALKLAPRLPAGYLSLNASPTLLMAGLLDHMLVAIGRDIVVEVTERDAVTDYQSLAVAMRGLRSNCRVAVDDTGSGYAGLRHLLDLRPDVIKIDILMVRGLEADPARQALIAALVTFAASIDAALIAEGVETDSQQQTLQALGVTLGQGFLLGRPEPIGSW